MFSEDQTIAGTRWLRKAVASQNAKEIEEINKVIKDEKRSKRFIMWLIFSFDDLAPLDKMHAQEFLYRWPSIVPDILQEACISNLRSSLEKGLVKGTKCEVCGQTAKEYKRAINANMSIFLRSLVIASIQDKSKGGDGWVHHSDLQYTGRDYTMVAHWGLADTAISLPDDDGVRKKKTTGYWKPTEQGINFVKGIHKVRSHIYMYNGRCREDEEAKYISIYEAIGQTFNFSDLFE